jgi:hypothetical protein
MRHIFIFLVKEERVAVALEEAPPVRVAIPRRELAPRGGRRASTRFEAATKRVGYLSRGERQNVPGD